VYKICKTKGVKPLKCKINYIKLNKAIRYNIIVYYIYKDINREIIKFYKANGIIAIKVIKRAKRRVKKD
jgi:hypothetical protein